MVEYIVAIDVTRVRFPADALGLSSCADQTIHSSECLKAREGSMVIGRPPVFIAVVIVASPLGSSKVDTGASSNGHLAVLGTPPDSSRRLCLDDAEQLPGALHGLAAGDAVSKSWKRTYETRKVDIHIATAGKETTHEYTWHERRTETQILNGKNITSKDRSNQKTCTNTWHVRTGPRTCAP